MLGPLLGPRPSGCGSGCLALPGSLPGNRPLWLRVPPRWRPGSPRGGQVGAAGDFCLGGHGITAQRDRLSAKQREGWRGGVNA